MKCVRLYQKENLPLESQEKYGWTIFKMAGRKWILDAGEK
jgi:hypothetical protein